MPNAFFRCSTVTRLPLFFFTIMALVSVDVHAQQAYIYLNEPDLIVVQQQIATGNSWYTDAYKKLLKASDALVAMDPNPVTKKTVMPPSGDRHDYLSLAPYAWPDTTKPDGLPWLTRDGEINPLTRGDNTDQVRLGKLWDALDHLALALYYSNDKRYAEKALSLIDVWFVDAATRVNPNINFGQGVPGVNTGRPAGVIEWTGITKVITMMQVLEQKSLMRLATKNAFDNWLTQYADWLTTSEIGIRESGQMNNHGTWYDYQLIGILRYLGRNDEAKQQALETKNRIAGQIMPDGAMPQELRRTKSVYYSEMNLRAFTLLAMMTIPLGVDLWGFQNHDGSGIQQAYAFLRPFANKAKDWVGKQITPGGVEAAINTRLQPLFVMTNSLFALPKLNADVHAAEGLSYIQRLTFPIK